MAGKVYLTGAGPGDPELLTLKALRVLKQADVVLHDDLVSGEILELAAPAARVVNVGKRYGQPHVRQQDIQALMIAYARRGLTVVRLKGGDPLIFSRAGEEIEALRAAHIEFEVIPGITAVAGAAAAARMPLTHRRLSSSLVLLTGHTSVENARHPWPKLSGGPGRGSASTVAVYMPGPDYVRLRDRLLEAGLGDQTPCVLISGAGRPDCVIHRTTVACLASALPLPSPCLLIAGAVAELASPKISTATPGGAGEPAAAELAVR